MITKEKKISCTRHILPRSSVAVSDDTWRIDVYCAFPVGQLRVAVLVIIKTRSKWHYQIKDVAGTLYTLGDIQHRAVSLVLVYVRERLNR